MTKTLSIGRGYGGMYAGWGSGQVSPPKLSLEWREMMEHLHIACDGVERLPFHTLLRESMGHTGTGIHDLAHQFNIGLRHARRWASGEVVPDKSVRLDVYQWLFTGACVGEPTEQKGSR